MQLSNLLIVLFLCQCSHLLAKLNDSRTVENVLARSNGFLFYMPKVVVLNRNETVCLTLHEIKPPVKVTVDIKWREKHSSSTRNLLTGHTCFDIYVQNLGIKEPSFVSVKVQIETSQIIQSAHNADPVMVFPKKIIKTHIVTDRSAHKPGDKVRFRVLVLDEHLLPQNSKIPEIKIKNPLDVTVAVWENITPENGLVIQEYQLVNEALLGKWKIEALNEEHVFEVIKYILPRYKLSLLHPTSIYYLENNLNVSVCGHYSHGRHVEGLAFIRITCSHTKLSLYYMKKMANGCANFFIPSEKLVLTTTERIPNNDSRMFLYITSTITESGTNRIDITNGRVYIYFKPYTIKFVSSAVFQPGLPYKGKVKLFNVKKNVSNDSLEICYNLALRKSWNYLNMEHCSNFTVDNDNSVEFSVLPLKNTIIHIILKARSLDYVDIEDKLLVARLYSLSNSYISLHHQITRKADDECRASQQFKVIFTADRLNENDNITFYYMIKSSMIYKQRKLEHQVKKTNTDYLTELDNIVGQQHKFIKLGVSVDSFVIKFRLDRRIISKYRLLVYYITDYGEIVAVDRQVEVEPCLMKVTAKWNQQQVVPGAIATLNLETTSNSICTLTAVDKATTFLPNQKPLNDMTNLLKYLSSQDRDPGPSGRKTCITPTRKPGTLITQDNETLDNHIVDLERAKRHVYSFSEDFDAYDTFNRFGIAVITNLNLITKTCYAGPLIKEQTQAQFLTEYDDHNEEQVVSIRSYFPETWLWELIPVSKSVQLNRYLPHSLTSWVTNVLCVSEEEGIGVSDQIEITSFQSFFVEVLNPHSIKRGEVFSLTVHISNYLMQTFPVRIIIRLSKGLELVRTTDKLMLSKCFQKNSSATHVVQLKATKIGSVTVTVLVEADNKFPEECGPETIISKRDIVLRKIQVQSEGYPLKVTKSALLCTSANSGWHESSNVTWDIQTPANLVQDTDHTYISLNGDLLGNTIENLESLLEVPTGCGEQIMASIAPNLYVLRYLNGTGALKHSVKQKIVKYLKIGYQRILNYVHKNGSFSAFGYHDPTGSMFLTAFVTRILQEAKKYIYVDPRIINKAVNWIYEHQLENGCFDAMLHVFQDMGGTSKENSTASLTAYVIISLLESNIEIPEIVQTNAKYCIKAQQNPDKYTLAISCYALFKMKWFTEAEKMLTKLLAVAEQQNNMLWWKSKDNESSTTDVEITSYVLLSVLTNNNTYNMAKAHSIVRWLSSKFSTKGAFKTTQDTVVALDALSKYSQMVKVKNINLTIDIKTDNYNETVRIESSNKMKSRRISLKKFVGNINVIANGEGCVLAQVTHVYYLLSIPKSEAFRLAVDVSPVSTIDKCSIVSLSPCLAYTGPDDISNMAVMEVSFPTGYEADRASLYKLVDTESNTGVKMFEELGQTVNLYLTKLGKQLICFEFNLNKYSNIQNMKNASIKLFDYYKPEYEIWEFYKIHENCTLDDMSTIIPTFIGAEGTKGILTNGQEDLTEVSTAKDV